MTTKYVSPDLARFAPDVAPSDLLAAGALDRLALTPVSADVPGLVRRVSDICSSQGTEAALLWLDGYWWATGVRHHGLVTSIQQVILLGGVRPEPDERPTYKCPCGETVYIGMEARHWAKDHEDDLGPLTKEPDPREKCGPVGPCSCWPSLLIDPDCECKCHPWFGESLVREATPKCDLCDDPQECGREGCTLCPGDWNGETGCHKSCEQVAAAVERDPIEVYGTPEHEAWLIEMERRGDYQ